MPETSCRRSSEKRSKPSSVCSGDRIGKLLLKQAVEQNICNHILASDTDIDAATYQKMRGMSYQEVLRTNGQISFPEVLRQQKRL